MQLMQLTQPLNIIAPIALFLVLNSAKEGNCTNFGNKDVFRNFLNTYSMFHIYQEYILHCLYYN